MRIAVILRSVEIADGGLWRRYWVNTIRVYRFGEGVRADFSDSDNAWKMIPMVDLSLRNGQQLCAMQANRALLRVGLGRPFQKDQGPAACYLQVNHVLPIPEFENIEMIGARL